MSITSKFGFPVLMAPKPPTLTNPNGPTVLGSVIECSSRPKKKATSHHMKTRPRKTQPWDIRRKPTVYETLPPLPPDWTLVSSAVEGEEAASPSSPLLSSASVSLEAPGESG